MDHDSDPFFIVNLLRADIAALELRLDNAEVLAQAWKASAKEWKAKAHKVQEWTLAGVTRTYDLNPGTTRGE